MNINAQTQGIIIKVQNRIKVPQKDITDNEYTFLGLRKE